MIGFLAPIVGGLSLKKGLLKWHSIVASVGFALILFKMRDGFTELFKSGIGPMLMGVAALAGLAVSILSIVKPQPR